MKTKFFSQFSYSFSTKVIANIHLKKCPKFHKFVLAHSDDESKCDKSWEPFKEEKYFKIFDKIGLKNYQESDKFCKDNNSTLITIHLKEEQDFISEFFKNQKVSNDAWIGVKYRNKRYEWSDGSDAVYQNWPRVLPNRRTTTAFSLT